MAERYPRGTGKHRLNLLGAIFFISFSATSSSWESLLTLFPTSAMNFGKRLGGPRKPSNKTKLFLWVAANALHKTRKDS